MASTKHFTTRLRQIVFAVSLAYITALLLGTHWPKLPAIGPEGTDKVLHFSAYSGLAFLVSLSVFWSRKLSSWHLILMFIAVTAFGGCDELTQPPFGRTADWYDWFADAGGAIAGVFLAAIVNYWLRRATAQEKPEGASSGAQTHDLSPNQ